MLFDYILDAIGAPHNGYESDGQIFSRANLKEMFYSNFILNKQWKTELEVLDALICEADDLASQWGYKSI